MSGFEAFLYFTLVSIDMTFNYPFAILWSGSVSLIYVITGLISLASGDGDSDGKGKGGKGSSKDGGEYKEGSMKDSDGTWDKSKEDWNKT